MLEIWLSSSQHLFASFTLDMITYALLTYSASLLSGLSACGAVEFEGTDLRDWRNPSSEGDSDVALNNDQILNIAYHVHEFLLVVETLCSLDGYIGTRACLLAMSACFVIPKDVEIKWRNHVCPVRGVSIVHNMDALLS